MDLFKSMKLRNLVYYILAATLLIGAADYSSIEAKRSKSRTSQTYKKKKKNRKKKRNKNKRGKSGKGNTIRRYSRPVPPPDPVSYDSLTLLVNGKVLEWIPEKLNPGGLRVNNVKTDSISRSTKVSLNENFTYLPVTQEFISDLGKIVKPVLPEPFNNYPVTLNVGRHPLAYYITKVDKLPEEYRNNTPFVVERDPYIKPRKGMENDIVALWSSHGRYFRPESGAWMWQRPVLFETLEDIYTMGYVLPYLVPMLENAGAYVFLPRERDTNPNEVIVDNDTNEGGEIFSQPYYKEVTGDKKWKTGEGEGFIYDLADFRDTENPFENGTYRQVETIKNGKPSIAAWCADIPETGEYAIYISYKSLTNSTTDARYTVNYSGGSKEFIVNQTMGGGTWIYLGSFPFEAGFSATDPIVTLSNLSDNGAGYVVTADALKIGGGMGNIARSSHRSDIYFDPSTPDNTKEELDEADDENDVETMENKESENGNPPDETLDQEQALKPEEVSPTPPASKTRAPKFLTSGVPRFVEGARYWLHWAGFPESVYSPYHGSNDYKDDYTSRGHWVNYLAGGSRVLPNQNGLNLPVDIAFALHSDAGKRSDDSFVGTLGIYYTNGGDSYEDGTPRINSRMLTDIIMRQITGDIRQEYEPRWTRRSMWDKSYVEARVPEVPTTLIELMSHQNYADMMYGLDPGFRFTVARSIYKAMARFMGERKDREVVIQPLPVKNFAISRRKKNHFRLSWEPVEDRLEPTAKPNKYIIEERSGASLGFHKIGETESTHFDVVASDHEIHSFKVIAANYGGVSFPSEVLSFREGPDEKKQMLIVNGFTRISGPEHFSENGNAGFRSEKDFGVPYIKDISFSGHQTVFSRSAGNSFGQSGSGYTSKVIAGNTFDYPLVHGISAANAGYGFVSSSLGAVESGKIALGNYKNIDLILGKQKATIVGNGKSGVKYRTIPAFLQQEIAKYLKRGGNLIVTGQYIVSDLYGKNGNRNDSIFAADVLGVETVDSLKSRSGQFFTLANQTVTTLQPATMAYSNNLNEKQYIVEQPDALYLLPETDGEVIMELTDTHIPVGIARSQEKGKLVISSIPFESILDYNKRDALMQSILNYMNK